MGIDTGGGGFSGSSGASGDDGSSFGAINYKANSGGGMSNQTMLLLAALALTAFLLKGR